ncbi:hypothetical protein PPTG_22041 [Phytophthora nicotianae INRA-310]|uniref:Uncharacterized protein n=1 Tax=Phytophthora nicotianae (strain INRA-310) TaxID=761204 RepID=W2QRQ5_PHYN3|nr:hypothetical protein PPTG_22041 [Phytophthora nicotianae INRA-310]ETN14940.1 hypothetical protein PPTG_22041 [Phytophthora nicotianae INRA-310]
MSTADGLASWKQRECQALPSTLRTGVEITGDNLTKVNMSASTYGISRNSSEALTLLPARQAICCAHRSFLPIRLETPHRSRSIHQHSLG